MSLSNGANVQRPTYKRLQNHMDTGGNDGHTEVGTGGCDSITDESVHGMLDQLFTMAITTEEEWEFVQMLRFGECFLPRPLGSSVSGRSV